MRYQILTVKSIQRQIYQRISIPNVRFFSQAGNKIDKVEEEILPWFASNRFYPVKIGSVFNNRYQVLGKLGYGSCSTSWLCKDMLNNNDPYVAMKVYERDAPQGLRELAIYQHLNSITTRHVGCLLVRKCSDHFNITTLFGKHVCLIHAPMEMSISTFRRQMPQRRMPEHFLKTILIHLLQALDFLHTEAGVIHTDIGEKNLMLEIEDNGILSRFEEAEKTNPSVSKTDGESVIYHSRRLDQPGKRGRPILCDFGEARMGAKSFHEDIQPYLYRAPEVLLRMRWDEKVDIWNVGVLVWDLFLDRHMFCARDAENNDSNMHHLAEMVAFLGPPPKELLIRSEYASNFFTAEGQWKGACNIPSLTLWEAETNLQGLQKSQFFRFMRKMLCWLPEERATAADLLQNSWLTESQT